MMTALCLETTYDVNIEFFYLPYNLDFGELFLSCFGYHVVQIASVELLYVTSVTYMAYGVKLLSYSRYRMK